MWAESVLVKKKGTHLIASFDAALPNGEASAGITASELSPGESPGEQ